MLPTLGGSHCHDAALAPVARTAVASIWTERLPRGSPHTVAGVATSVARGAAASVTGTTTLRPQPLELVTWSVSCPVWTWPGPARPAEKVRLLVEPSPGGAIVPRVLLQAYPAGSAMVPLPGSEFEFECDVVVYAIGTNANPILGQTSKLALDKRGYIAADDGLATSIDGVFAGGDIVTGAATVIEAMGAGRKAARSMRAWLGIRDTETVYLPERAGSDETLFGIDPVEKTFARVRLA